MASRECWNIAEESFVMSNKTSLELLLLTDLRFTSALTERSMQLINANAALVELFIYSHIGHETLSMRTINTGIHRVCQIEFTKEIYQE